MVSGARFGTPRATAKSETTSKTCQWLAELSDVNDALEVLGSKGQLKFPSRNDVQTPSKRPRSPGHDAKQGFSQLFFVDRDMLVEAVGVFLEASSKIQREEGRMDYLLTRLKAAEEKSTKLSRRSHLLNGRTSQPNTREPPSPSSSIKHAPKVSLVEQIPLFSEPGLANADIPVDTDLPDADISHNTSFANTSFWSKMSTAYQEAVSPASTVESYYSSQEKADGDAVLESSWSATTVVNPHVAKKRQRDAYPLPETLGKEIFPPVSALPHQFPPATVSDANHRPMLNDISSSDSKGLEDHRVRNIPNNGFSQVQLPESFLKLRLCLRLEAYRILQTNKLSAEDLDHIWQEPRTLASLYSLADSHGLPLKPGFKKETDDFELSGKIRWTRKDRKDSIKIFELELSMPSKDRSTSFQRKFGRRRFLQLDLPSLRDVPSNMGLGQQQQHIENRVHELLGLEHVLLGCKWRLLLVQSKKKKIRYDEDFKKSGAVQLLFFAVDSICPIDKMQPISIVEVVDWAVPLRENKERTACKAYARLELSASRTNAVFVLKRDEIAYNIRDIQPNDVPDDLTFIDPNFDFTEPDSGDDVLSDGQSWISPWLMGRIRDFFKLDYLPTAVQGRLFGAKGIWYLFSADPVPLSKPDCPLIGISASQIKAWQKQSSFSLDAHNLTFNVVKVSHPPSTSLVYAGFLPILVDRGVQQNRLHEFVERMAENETQEFLSAIKDRISLQKWVHKQIRPSQDTVYLRDADSEFPRANPDRIQYMLQSCFEPTENGYLAERVRLMGKWMFDFKMERLKIAIPKSTMVLGMADPYGYLLPGEVHINFSRMFEDSETKDRWAHLHGWTALVARNPALWASDIQKVRMVYEAKLAHLPDVVIFPGTGKRSLASKLSGGDYDGDTFWLCWQPELVKDFRNAPAHWKLPDPQAEFGICVDHSKLGVTLEIHRDPVGPPNEEKVVAWLMEQAKARIRGNMLGRATRAHEKAVYHSGTPRSKTAKVLAALHDHLVDADKQGYRFDERHWEEFKKRHKVPDQPDPAYRRFVGDMGTDSDGRDKPLPKPDNVLDQIYSTVDGVFQKGMEEAKTQLSIGPRPDADLNGVYDDFANEANDVSFIHGELTLLEFELEYLIKEWAKESSQSMMESSRAAPKSAGKGIEERAKVFRKMFRDISPGDRTHPRALEWVRRLGKTTPTTWECLRASALAKLHYYKRSFLIWNIAGDELCRLKVRTSGGTRELELKSYFELKPISRKRVVEEMLNDDDDDDDDDDGESESEEALF